jgi:hypothetical protein
MQGLWNTGPTKPEREEAREREQRQQDRDREAAARERAYWAGVEADQPRAEIAGLAYALGEMLLRLPPKASQLLGPAAAADVLRRTPPFRSITADHISAAVQAGELPRHKAMVDHVLIGERELVIWARATAIKGLQKFVEEAITDGDRAKETYGLGPWFGSGTWVTTVRPLNREAPRYSLDYRKIPTVEVIGLDALEELLPSQVEQVAAAVKSVVRPAAKKPVVARQVEPAPPPERKRNSTVW